MDSILDHEKNNFEIEPITDDMVDDFESVPLPNQVPGQITNSAISPLASSSYTAPVAAPASAGSSAPIFKAESTLSSLSTPQDTASKSRAVQTLLSQNQDLMARLTVALKRNVELEQKIDSQEEVYQSLATQYDVLKDQAAVHIEKNKHLEFENQRLFEQSSALEKRFAELYSVYQDKINYIQKMSYRLHRFLQYRKRIKGIVRPFITKLKTEIVDLKNQILVLNEQGIKQLEYINELKKNYSDAIDRIQAITAQNEKTQMDLTQYHETRYQTISDELNTIKTEASSLKTENAELKASVERYAENEASLSNKAIFFERKYTDLKNEFEQVSQEFIQQKTADNTRMTNLEIQLKETSSQLAKISEQKTAFENENRQLIDQLQSIQLLYQDNLTKIEELKKQNHAQDQINKELSQSLLETRKRADHLQEKLVAAEEEFKRKLQAFQVRFNKVNSEPISANQLHAMNEQSKTEQKELLSKIQSLLSEIQAGHSSISNISFEENKPAKDSSELISEFGDIENRV